MFSSYKNSALQHHLFFIKSGCRYLYSLWFNFRHFPWAIAKNLPIVFFKGACASIGILLVNICVAHIWIYPKFLSIFALFWGFVLAAKDNEYFEIETDWDEEEEDNEKEGLQI